MIKLTSLLREIASSKKAIIMAGAAGAGKGTFIKNIEAKYPQAVVLNPDTYFVPQLKSKGVSLDLKNVFAKDREGISKAASAMATARGEYGEKLKSSLDEPILIFDITSNAYAPILKLKTELEKKGYEVMMVYLYVPLSTALDQNDKRYEKSKGEERSIQPTAVVDTWFGVVSNFSNYKELFDDNFIAFTNSKEPTFDSFDDLKKKYIDPYSPMEKVIDLPKEVEDDFNEKIKSLGSLNSFEIRKLKEKALEFYNKNQSLLPLKKQGRTNGFIETLASIRKQSEENKKEKEELKSLLNPNNPLINDIIDSTVSKEEAISKISNFLK